MLFVLSSSGNPVRSWTYSWMTPLLKLGYSRPLQLEDLWPLESEDEASEILSKFLKSWADLAPSLVASKCSKSWLLVRILFHAFGSDFLKAAWFVAAGNILIVASPVLLLFLLGWLQDYQQNKSSPYFNSEFTQSVKFPYLLVVLMFIAQVASTFATNANYELSTKTGYRIRTSLTMALYQKGFKLSLGSKQLHPSGKIVNISVNDTNRLDLACQFLHQIWAAPFLIIMASGLLIWILGVSALVGVGTMLLYFPFQHYILKYLAIFRRKANHYADKRIKIISEVIAAIRVIKVYAWESSFRKSIGELRTRELKHVVHFLYVRASVSAITQVTPVFAMIFSFVCYSLVADDFNPYLIFSSLSLFYCLRVPMLVMPLGLTQSIDAWVAAERVATLLLAEEISSQPVHLPADSDGFAIQVLNSSFSWNPPNESNSIPAVTPSEPKTGSPAYVKLNNDSKQFVLENVNFEIPKGALVAIVGAVGTGKSSLLSALIGEMEQTKGEPVIFRGRVAYCQQQAWIQNSTLRDNILFGLPYDEERYKEAIKVCCLQPDIDMLIGGDLTEIGEKGINLSGGQKQRISIARAVYSNPDIYLFDDQLSAVDSHVGKSIFTKCINGLLKNKTRILVTHQLQFVPQADLIFQMDSKGNLIKLTTSSDEFIRLMASYGEDDNERQEPVRKGSSNTSVTESKNEETKEKQKGLTFIQNEERTFGSVRLGVFHGYVLLAGGSVVYFVTLFNMSIAQISRVMTDQWLSFWTLQKFDLDISKYIYIYVIIGIFQTLAILNWGTFNAYFGAKASANIHDVALKGILGANIAFFDSTPQGRITSRFSRDIDTLDNLLPESMRVFLFTFFFLIANFILISIVFPYFLIPLAPVVVGFFYFQRFYSCSTRELKRLDSITRSPVVSTISETLTGLGTIRAYGATGRFEENAIKAMNSNNTTYFPSILLPRWMQLRLEVANSFLVFFATLFSVIFKDTVSASVSGLAISYAVLVTATITWCIKQAVDSEMNMNSAERMLYYKDSLPQEGVSGANIEPPIEWPTTGFIEAKDLCLKYREDLPNVLSGVSFLINGGEKVGIVGRTGAGKSTILSCILRLFELESGSILIDGLDISGMPLQRLRSAIGIIPQDPVLFSGTIRSNLDPFNQYTDDKIWEIVKRAGIALSEAGLDTVVQENGLNFSTGERQLICLARAMLKNSKILMLDEATASVDQETDARIQKAIRIEFCKSTVITIAHRLNTIADYDKIIVLKAGRVIECGTPASLLEIVGGEFASMVSQTGTANSATIHKLAKR